MSDLSRAIALSEALNQYRMELAQHQLTDRQVLLLHQLPWLLHRNHADEPGYLPGAPAGFTHPPITPGPVDEAYSGPLMGLYTMGSTGTFGQGPESDLDCWLVHPIDMPEADKSLLRQRCELLEQHYLALDVELHLYLISPDLLEQGQSDKLSKEHSGSAQVWLLLEEFYRTQIHLAGLPLAWWPGAPQDHPGLLSLGELTHLPGSEFFSASLWQLFKGMDRPHKAALKVLLLEAYSGDYPDQRILRDQLWNRLRAGQVGPRLDPYLMLYEKVNAYLERERDDKRLAMMRRCFYLKCGVKLSQVESQADWRFPTLQQLTTQWGWSQGLLRTLDRANHWHAGELNWYNERLDRLMLASYRRLTGINARKRMPSQLRLDELSLLTRKLYTRFDQDASKVPLLNPLWSELLTEAHLTLVAVGEDPSFGSGWYLYRGAASDNQLFGESPLHYADSRQGNLCWALVNGLVGPKTQVHSHLQDDSGLSERMTQLMQRMRQWIRRPEPADLTALQTPWRHTRAVVLCNLDDDPSSEPPPDQQEDDDLAMPECCVKALGSLTLYTENSWGEAHYHRFRGPDAILRLLDQLLAGLDHEVGPIPLQILSTAEHHANHLEQSLGRLFEKIQNKFSTMAEDTTEVYALQLGRERYQLMFDLSGLRWQVLRNDDPLAAQLNQGALVLSGPGEPDLNQVPDVIGHYAREGMMQVFVLDRARQLELFLVDEHNTLQHSCHPNGQARRLLEEINQIYASKSGLVREGLGTGESFNLPQYYRLSADQQGHLVVSPLEF